MKYPYAWTAIVLSTLTFGIACGDDDAPGNPGNAASGSAGRGGGAGSGAAVGGAGGADHGVAGGADPGGAPGEGGLGGAVAGESLGGVGAEGGGAAQPEHWLAFQLWTEDENAHPLFFSSVPQADPVEVAPDVSFWQWAPDGTRLVYTTLAAYGGPPNAAFSVAVSATGALGAPERLHEPLGEGALALRVSISPDSKTLALQLYEETISTWYLRPLDGGVGDWTPVTTSAPGAELPIASDVRLIWSPDGARAAIIQREDATHDSLFIVDAMTGEGSQGSFGTLRPFQWSADGSRFIAEALGAGQRVLYAIDADAASNAVELAESAVNFGFDPHKFAVSSDGDTVAFSAAVSGASGGVALLKQVASAQPAVQVGDSPRHFIWSERSEQFFFTGAQGVTTHLLYAVPRQGGDVVRVNPEGTSAECNVQPCLRAAGDALLFMTSDADQGVIGNQLYDIDLSTPSPSARPLTAFAANEVIDFIALSPNFSNVLLVATNPAGKHGIYLVDRSAAPPSVTRVFNPAAGTYSLSPLGWSPDSRFFDLQADPDKDGYVDLFAVAAGSDTAGLRAPLTPQGRKIRSVSAKWRPRQLP